MADLPYWKFPHILIYACQMGDEAWADLLGLPLEDVSAWLEGDKERAIPANDRLTTLTAIVVALGQMRDGRGIAAWLMTSADTGAWTGATGTTGATAERRASSQVSAAVTATRQMTSAISMTTIMTTGCYRVRGWGSSWT